MTTTHPRESLYLIESTLEQIQLSRAEAEGDGDSDALKVIDQIEREYLTKEGSKIDSYVGLIRKREDFIEACDREMERIASLRKSALGDVERLKGNALSVMQHFDVKMLKNELTGRGLRRQVNGGMQALEITDADALPDNLQIVEVDITLDVWRAIQQAFEGDPRFKFGTTFACHMTQPNTELIREALKQRIPCPLCAPLIRDGIAPCEDCVRCNGEGTIPQTIPGVRLLERGEHVRVI